VGVPTAVQWVLIAITISVGLTGGWFQWLGIDANGRASSLVMDRRIGRPNDETTYARIREAAEKRRLFEKAHLYETAGVIALFCALISGLTISFPVFWAIGIGIALMGLVLGCIAPIFLKSINGKIDRYLRARRISLVRSGIVFTNPIAELNSALRASREETRKIDQELEMLESTYANELKAFDLAFAQRSLG
jgi:hypothetical protein